MLVSHFSPVRLALIAADKDTYPAVEQACARFGVVPNLFVSPYEDMHVVAHTQCKDIDIILCRIGSAENLQHSASKPVVSIPITPFDLICAMEGKNVEGKKIAFISYCEEIPCVDRVASLFRCSIRQYTFTDKESIGLAVARAKEDGADMCIGGTLTMRATQLLGFEGIKVYPNQDTVSRAVQEAKQLVLVSREERDKAARLQVVFDTISEGIIVTDNKNDVIIYNPAAARIYNRDESAVLGRNAQEVIPQAHMHTVFEKGEPEINHLQKIGNDIIATNTQPITVEGTPIGVVSTLNDVTKIQQLEELIRKQIHSKGFVAKYTFENIQTADSAMLECKKLGAIYAPTNASVIIEGESGTGKELFAQSIHNASKRASGPFVAVNCAAIPDTLLESELFGYEGGSFTGAKKEGKQGLFELAHNGTIFLDEISELPASLQARLLRVLQEKEVRRVGGDKVMPVDIRIISATNRNIRKNVAEGTFRDDLFFRLNVFHLKIPPLRARKSDIPLLAKTVFAKSGVKVPEKYLQSVFSRLASYDWPGNVRELLNLMERIALLSKHGGSGMRLDTVLDVALEKNTPGGAYFSLTVDTDQSLKKIVADVEKKVVSQLMAANNQDRDLVAQKLGIGKTSVWRKGR